MSFKTAKDQIIQMLKDTIPTEQLSVYGSQFVFDEYTDSEDIKPQSRTFFYDVSAGVTRAGQCSRQDRGVELTISIFYREDRDKDEIYEVIMSDYELITNHLLLPANWNQSTSKIKIISTGEDDIFEFSIEQEEEGAFLVFNLPLIYTN